MLFHVCLHLIIPQLPSSHSTLLHELSSSSTPPITTPHSSSTSSHSFTSQCISLPQPSSSSAQPISTPLSSSTSSHLLTSQCITLPQPSSSSAQPINAPKSPIFFPNPPTSPLSYFSSSSAPPNTTTHSASCSPASHTSTHPLPLIYTHVHVHVCFSPTLPTTASAATKGQKEEKRLYPFVNTFYIIIHSCMICSCMTCPSHSRGRRYNPYKNKVLYKTYKCDVAYLCLCYRSQRPLTFLPPHLPPHPPPLRPPAHHHIHFHFVAFVVDQKILGVPRNVHYE